MNINNFSMIDAINMFGRTRNKEFELSRLVSPILDMRDFVGSYYSYAAAAANVTADGYIPCIISGGTEPTILDDDHWRYIKTFRAWVADDTKTIVRALGYETYQGSATYHLFDATAYDFVQGNQSGMLWQDNFGWLMRKGNRLTAYVDHLGTDQALNFTVSGIDIKLEGS